MLLQLKLLSPLQRQSHIEHIAIIQMGSMNDGEQSLPVQKWAQLANNQMCGQGFLAMADCVSGLSWTVPPHPEPKMEIFWRPEDPNDQIHSLLLGLSQTLSHPIQAPTASKHCGITDVAWNRDIQLIH